MAAESRHPLDYDASDYAYLERPNATLLELFRRRALVRSAAPRVLDVGAGAGANARAMRELAPSAHLTAIEPNRAAAALLSAVCDRVHAADLEHWLREASGREIFDVVVLSDVLEHWADPVRGLRRLVEFPGARDALFLVSVPNYAVWYNRVRTLFGRFEYAPSGLYDRTHLRFFTRASIGRLLEYTGLELIEQRVTPSLVQSLAPVLRRAYSPALRAGEHLALDDSRPYRAYRALIEPIETRACELWPSLLGFQIVSAAARGCR